MALKHIIKEIIRIRKHIYNLQSLYFVEKLRPLYCKRNRLNSTQLLRHHHKCSSLYFLRNFTTTTTHAYDNNKNTAVYAIDSEELLVENEDLLDDETDKPNIRNILYKNSKDPLVQELNECASVQDVFNIIRKNSETMDAVQISQAVLVLWDLQKIFYKHNIYYENERDATNELNANAILKKYITQVSSHEDFDTLISLIKNNYEKFSVDALTCTLLYLHRMGVALKTNAMQLMIARCERDIKNCDKATFPLTALSRFIVTIYYQERLYPILVSIDALAIVLQRLECCETKEDFKLLTICLYRMKELLTLENIETYKKITFNLIDAKKITQQNSRTILKALRFLSSLQWHEYTIKCTNKLMHLLKNSISQFNSRELLTIFKIFQLQKEPADMLEELQEHALYQVSNLEESSNSLETILDLLSCVVLFSSPLEKPRFERLSRRYVENNLSFGSLGALYKILYHLKSNDATLCNKFWDKCFEVSVKNGRKEDVAKNALALCLKYSHFSQDIGHKYRYEAFEESLIEVLVQEMHTLEPETFLRVAPFIIAYSRDASLDERVIDELLQLRHFLSAFDVLNIARGVQFALQHKYKSNCDIWMRFQALNGALSESIAQEIETETRLPMVNILLRSYCVMRNSVEEGLFARMLDVFVRQPHQINSHILKDVSFYLQINGYLRPDVVDQLTGYVVEHNESVLGNTVEKVLQLCYSLGYTPSKNADQFFDVASNIIVRDQERLTGLTFLQTSLALCYFHKLPEMLIKQIFSVDFLEKLDEELSNCYAKTTYPMRVREHMMQLNRAVCLDYPQSSVPWFHEKYTEQSKKQILKQNFFQKQVFATLQDILEKDSNNETVSLSVNTYSPYGYRLDFELTTTNKKAAILLLTSNSFTNCAKNLKGFFQLRQRHLEILGYNVVNINYDEWKTFYVQQDCIKYVRDKLLHSESLALT